MVELIFIKAREIQGYLRLLAIITQACKHSLIIYRAAN